MNPQVIVYSSAHCPFCTRAKRLLEDRGVSDYQEIRVDESTESRARMIALTGRRTVPQIFINSHHVGGFDDLAALDRRGALAPMLEGRL